MAGLRVYGLSDDCVEFDGAISEEFYLRADDTWVGEIQAPNGDSVGIKVSYYVDNPNGWYVGVFDEDFTSEPWPYHIEEIYNESYDNDVDLVLFIDVPEGIVVSDK